MPREERPLLAARRLPTIPVARHPLGRQPFVPLPVAGTQLSGPPSLLAEKASCRRNTMSAAGHSNTGPRTQPQTIALAFGAIYLLVGIVGFFITGFDNFFGHQDETLLVFHVNPAHNIVHILIGVAGLLLARTLAGARTYGWLLAAGYGAAFLYGLFAVGADWDFLNLNWADNILHLATAIVGVVIAKMPARSDSRV